MKDELTGLFQSTMSQNTIREYQKLISFIDGSISQAFKLSGDDRSEFLVKNLLGMRDFLSSEITIERTKDSVKGSVIQLFDRFVSESDIDLEALREIRRKKKERELIKALEVGENSGFVEHFHPKQHLKELHRKHL